MGRKADQTIPYWQHESGLYDDPKMVRLNNKYGTLGEAVFERILDVIIKTNGYFTLLNDELIIYLVRSVGSKWIKFEVVPKIIQYCGVCGLFDVNLLSQNVITSRGIQRRWLGVKEKGRARGYSTAEFWLLEREKQDMPESCNNDNLCNNNTDKCSNNTDKCSNNSTIREDNKREYISNHHPLPIEPPLAHVDGVTDDDEDGNEIEFYYDSIEERVKTMPFNSERDYGQRLLEVCSRIIKVKQCTIGGAKFKAVEILKAYVSLFCAPNRLQDAFATIDNEIMKGTVKNQFTYTVAALYNATT